MLLFGWMNYVNPFGLFAIPRGNGLDPNAIKQARSRALAEFELSQDTTVKFGETALNRSDVLAAFDLLNDERKAGWLWDMSGNLDLETFIAQKGKVAHPPEYWGPLDQREYRAFTLEWIPPAMKTFLAEAIQRKDALSCRPIFEALKFYSDVDLRVILSPVFDLLNRTNNTLGTVITGKFKWDKDVEILMESTEPFLIQFFNFLPHYLSNELTVFANTLKSLAAEWAPQHKQAKFLIPAIHETLLELNLSVEAKQPSIDFFLQHLGKERYFRNQILVGQKRSKPYMPAWASNMLGCVMVIVVIILTVVLFKIGISIVFSSGPGPAERKMEDIRHSAPDENPTFPSKPDPDPQPGQ